MTASRHRVDGLDPRMPFRDAAALVVEARASRLLTRVDELHERGDPDSVHDARVAARRMRAALELFRPCFPPPKLRRALRETRRTAGRLGEQRDTDVAAAWVESVLASCGAAERPGVNAFLRELRDHREANAVDLAAARAAIGGDRLRSALAALGEPPGGAADGTRNAKGDSRPPPPARRDGATP